MEHQAFMSVAGEIISVVKSHNGNSVYALVKVENNGTTIIPLAFLGTLAEQYPATSMSVGDEIEVIGNFQFTTRNKSKFELIVTRVTALHTPVGNKATPEETPKTETLDEIVARKVAEELAKIEVAQQPAVKAPADWGTTSTASSVTEIKHEVDPVTGYKKLSFPHTITGPSTPMN
jgi:hypothetical protein